MRFHLYKEEKTMSVPYNHKVIEKKGRKAGETIKLFPEQKITTKPKNYAR